MLTNEKVNNHSKQVIKNSAKIAITSLILRVLSAFFAFLLIFLYITKFGDSVNGIVRSTAQLVGLFGVVDGGIGAAVVYKLYIPLRNKNYQLVNEIFSASAKVFRKIGYLYMVILLMSISFYPFALNITIFSNWYIRALILALGVPSMFAYMFTSKYSVLLSSDQKLYKTYIINIFYTLISNMIAISMIFIFPNKPWYVLIPILINSGFRILINFTIMFYVKKHYPWLKKIKTTINLHNLFMNSFIHRLSIILIFYFDDIILSISSYKFGNEILIILSIYSLYISIASTLRILFRDIILSSNASIGQNINLNKKINFTFFKYYEFLTFVVVAFVFMNYVIIAPFFITTIFGQNHPKQYFDITLTILSGLMLGLFLIRHHYWALIKSYGHFKETRNHAIIELVINLILSIILVWFYKADGVIFATIISFVYRFIVIRRYCVKNLLKNYDLKIFIKNLLMLISLILVSIFGLLYLNRYINYENINFINLFWIGFGSVSLTTVLIVLFNLLINFKSSMVLLSYFKFLRKYDYFKKIYQNKNISLQ